MHLINSIRVLSRACSTKLKPASSSLQIATKCIRLPLQLATRTRECSAQTGTHGDISDEVVTTPVSDENPLDRILNNNRQWRQSMLEKDPSYFKTMAKGQTPEYLLIGCSDSRLGAEKIMGLDLGEVFIHRNIANVFIPTDMNLLSVLFYAVTVLKVKEIIVLGHYGCGGVLAASGDGDLGYFQHWLRNIRNVQNQYKEELDKLSDPEDRHRRLVELNVQEQCFNLHANSIVQNSQAKTDRPRIHGMVYDIGEGLLKDLDIDFQSDANKYKDVHTETDFEKCIPLDINHVIGTKIGKNKLDRLVTIEAGGYKAYESKRSYRPLKCSGKTTIRHLKLAIRSVSGIPIERQNLYYNNRKLSEDDALMEDIGTGSIASIYPIILKEKFVPDLFKRP